jgi:hypothetical protein
MIVMQSLGHTFQDGSLIYTNGSDDSNAGDVSGGGVSAYRQSPRVLNRTLNGHHRVSPPSHGVGTAVIASARSGGALHTPYAEVRPIMQQTTGTPLSSHRQTNGGSGGAQATSPVLSTFAQHRNGQKHVDFVADATELHGDLV